MNLKILLLSIYMITFLLDFPITLCDDENSMVENIKTNKIIGSMLFIAFVGFWFYGPNLIDILLNSNTDIDVTDLFVAEPKPYPTKGIPKEAIDVPKEEIVKRAVDFIYPDSKN